MTRIVDDADTLNRIYDLKDDLRRARRNLVYTRKKDPISKDTRRLEEKIRYLQNEINSKLKWRSDKG